ncbi:MAG: penicillin-binding transpeptidase domain-containing protein [Chloroflexota bacterium]
MRARWKQILFSGLLLLTACSGGDVASLLPAPSDAFTPAPVATVPQPTAAATAVPVTEDATGYARAFYRAWEAFDYVGMYSLLSPQSQTLVDQAAFVQRYQEASETAAVLQIHSQPLSIFQENDRAEFSVRVTWQTAVVGDLVRDYVVPLVYANGRWGIVWDEGLILPELTGGNRLTLEYRIPSRANIYDRNGLALAYQGNVISLGIIPGQIVDEPGLLATLSPILNQTPEEIKALYAAALPDWYVPIGDIPEETMQTSGDALQPYIGAGLAPPQSRLARVYPDNGVAPHLIGYTGFIAAEELAEYRALGYRGDEMVGQAGLEAWGEDYLNGDRGGILAVVGSNGDYITTLQERESKQARSIYTTIDRDFQTAVEQALADALLSYGGSNAGAIVVLDVHTGAVRAIASYPSYNPAIFDAVRPEAAVALGATLSDPNRPLFNRATQGAYPAGSVFKIVTMSAALNSGLYTPDTRYNSTGTWARLGDNFIKRDWREGGHGNITLREALVVSCNSCFYDAGFNMDGQDSNLLPNTALNFGLGSVTGIEGQAEASGTIPSPQWKIENIGEGWVPGDAVNMSIGQGFVQVTPLQIADILAAVANGGTLYQPNLIDRIGAGGGAPEEPWPSHVRGELPLSPENLAVIQQSLWNVANGPTGTATDKFVGLPIKVAGKTGTAEDPPRNSHAWFAGYAPAAPVTLADGRVVNEPEIAIAVIAENGGEGSAVAAPIFRRIVELYYNITPLTPYPWQ